jgi:hypothetical protein
MLFPNFNMCCLLNIRGVLVKSVKYDRLRKVDQKFFFSA